VVVEDVMMANRPEDVVTQKDRKRSLDARDEERWIVLWQPKAEIAILNGTGCYLMSIKIEVERCTHGSWCQEITMGNYAFILLTCV
jgi:hypothetical protein